jgi:hypothetical protein
MSGNAEEKDNLQSSTRKWLVLYLVLAIASPLIYVGLTHHVWEDCLITLRQSRNLVDGNGLVFNPGHRVQGFTSCLNVMLLALFYAISGHSTDLAIDFYRAVCLIAYVCGGWVLLKMMLKNRIPDPLSPLIFILLYVTETKTVSYTMNGQESAFMVCFLAIGFFAAYNGFYKHWKVLALSFTGLLYTRPDSPIYIAAISLAGLVFPVENRKECWRGIIRAAVIAAILFAPWFISMWVYYGQPIPNTVLAKSEFDPALLLDPAGLTRTLLSKLPLVQAHLFEPINSHSGGWPRPVLDTYDMILWLIAFSYWMIPSQDRLGRLASLLFALGSLYLAFIMVAGSIAAWYVPADAVMGIFVVARGTTQIARQIPRLKNHSAGITYPLLVCLVIASLFIFVGQLIEIRIQQREIEDRGRKLIGLYMHDVVKPGQRIYLEPLGYIGYYSDRYIQDWPGLIAPEVVKLHHKKGTDRYTTIPELMPEWLVLRLDEMNRAFGIPQVHDNYVLVKTYDARPNLDSYGYFPGRGYVYDDAVFEVLRRKDVVPASEP